ncbi:MAG: outer membrane protein OmpA-like peptidoglycan-associated protein, partial [Myxococcota bacterium]
MQQLPFLLGLALALPASAQEPAQGFDAHGFHLAAHDGDPRDPISVQRAGSLTQGDFWVSGLGEYASSPLLLSSEDVVSGDVTRSAEVDNLTALNLSLGAAAHERVRFDLNAPLFLYNTDGTGNNGPPTFGDMRLSTMIMALSPDHEDGGAGIGVVGWLDLPSGAPARFLGQRTVAGGLKLAATYEAGIATLSGDLGFQANPGIELQNLTGSDTLLAGLAVGVLATDAVGVTGEVVFAPPLESNVIQGAAFPAEGILSMRYRDASGGFLTVGTAAGLSGGAGVAAWRLFVGGGFGRIQGGAAKVVELCPDGQPPLADRTLEDGCYSPLTIVATLDGRPHPAEMNILGPSGAARDNAGPAGVSLKSLPGERWSAVATSGACLAGEGEVTTRNAANRLEVPLKGLRDATLVLRVVDPQGAPVPGAVGQWTGSDPSCYPGPQTSAVDGTIAQQVGGGTYGLKVQAGGYQPFESTVQVAKAETREITVVLQPTRVEVTKEKIVILDKVYFETAKAIIKPASFALLDEVARTILDNPDIGRVEVAGHTDSQGSDSYNQGLSQDRAASVRRYLMDKSVSADRLLSRG